MKEPGVLRGHLVGYHLYGLRGRVRLGGQLERLGQRCYLDSLGIRLGGDYRRVLFSLRLYDLLLCLVLDHHQDILSLQRILLCRDLRLNGLREGLAELEVHEVHRLHIYTVWLEGLA